MRVPVSAHELHYTTNRTQIEELRCKTYLPYRQGLFGCLGFSSKSYSTINGFARSLHPTLSKFVGARFFPKGYEAMGGGMNTSFELNSPRDSDGHGTDTASTATGRYVYKANMLGYANGIAKGMMPKAWLATYKVCWLSGCYDSDILSAFDTAIEDGVDVISLSVGGEVAQYYLDTIAMGAFVAVERGVFVFTFAGNEDHRELSVTNLSSWVTTVGAGTLDRDFPAEIEPGDISVGKGRDSYSSSLCMEWSLDPKMVKGKIVVCDRENNPRVAKGAEVKWVRGVGMILANSESDREELVVDAHVSPASAIGAKEAELIRQYIATTKTSIGIIKFLGIVLGIQPAPVVASFSARGPNPETPYILKPDVIAPGVNILAVWTGTMGSSGLENDKRWTDFNIISGTSIACPHVSGIAALLKGAHPKWSPTKIRFAEIRSATFRGNSSIGNMGLKKMSGYGSRI